MPNLEMTLRLDRVIVGPQEAVTGLEAEAVHDRDHWKRIAVSAAIGDAPIRVRLDPVPGAPGAGRRKLVVASADAGAFGRVLDLYTNVRGGRLQLEAFIEDALPGEPVVGNLRLEDIRLVDTPVLAKLLTVGSLTGMVDLLRGEGIGFKKFDIPFRLTESRIDMAGAVGAGDALGITIEGTIDRKKETLDLRGTISPAYTINSLLSNLPIIGGLFTARPGEGIIGLNYTVKGPTAEPDVSVSFLSVLTPGFLRNITRLFAPPPPSIAPDGSRPPAPPMGDPGSHNPR
ncbi:MAG: hypothetical protein FJX47_20750 [Alphaproteobacteria bacterium]|nr:hypothetical protein [Alphaproteobacteria bacterium]